MPFLIPLAVWERRTFGPREPGQARLAWIAGLVFAADLVLWHHAIAAVGAGLATVIANTQVVIVGLTAWVLLGERPSPRLIAAVPVVLASSSSPASSARTPTATSRRSESYSGSAPRSRIRASCSCCGPGNRDLRRPAGPLLDATIAAAVGSAVAGVALGELELVPSWPEHGWLLLLAVSAQVIGWLPITASLPRLPAAVSSVLLTAQPAATVVLAMLLVEEDPLFVQLAGVVVVIVGVATVAGRRRPAERGIPT